MKEFRESFVEDINNVPNEWFKEGQNKELIYKFVAYYLAFSACYERFALIQEEKCNQNERNFNKLGKMERYVEENGTELAKLIDFSSPELEIFFKYPVLDGFEKPKEGVNYLDKNYVQKGQKKPIKRYRNLVLAKTQEEKTLYLLETVQRIRNNLFHGEKVPRNERDLELIKASVFVLESIKDFLIDDFKYNWAYSKVFK